MTGRLGLPAGIAGTLRDPRPQRCCGGEADHAADDDAGAHQVSEELSARGHEVRVVSSSAPIYRADLTTGAGLDEAIAGCDAVVDASKSSSKSAAATLVEGTRRLLLAGQRAGGPHHVCM
jgi:nucleoside-diphosphate-sugar epimerase